LSELYNCADFFIIGSPVETQCLAAIEACLCDIPVVMRNVGFVKDLTDKEKQIIGQGHCVYGNLLSVLLCGYCQGRKSLSICSYVRF
jgi:hypothetical protein